MSENSIRVSVHEFVSRRRSPVIFSPDPVSEELILQLAEAARWAPSSFNQQPWRFVFALREKPDEWGRMFGLLMPGNREWVQYNVPVLMMSVTETVPEGRHQPNLYAFHDAGLSAGNLIMQATSIGLFVHPMGGFDKERAKSELDIPEPFQPVAMFAIGYPGKTKGMPAALIERDQAERKRKPLEEILFRGKWNGPF